MRQSGSQTSSATNEKNRTRQPPPPPPSSRRRPGSSVFRCASTAAERRWILTFVRMTEKRDEAVGLANVVSDQRKKPNPTTPTPTAVIPAKAGIQRLSLCLDGR